MNTITLFLFGALLVCPTLALSQIFKKAQNEVILDEIMQRVDKIAQK